MTISTYARTLFFALALSAICSAALAEPSLHAIDEAIAAMDYGRALELIDSQIAATPDDVSLLFRRARVQSYVGDLDAALNTLNQLRERYPHDVDYALARAQVFARQGRDRVALAELRDAVVLAPDYEAVWQLQYTLLSRQQNERAHVELEKLSREAAVRFPHASWLRSAEIASDVRWTVLVGAGYEDLSNGFPSWSQQFIEVSREQASAGRYRLGVARDERFDNSDQSVLLGGDFSFASGWTTGLDVTFTGNPSFQPDLSVSGYVGRLLKDGWSASLRYRQREYESTTVGSATSTVEKYAGDFRFAYALGISRLQGSSSFMNHGLTMNWYYNEYSSIGITLNSGKEAESIGPGQVLETDVQGVSVSGRRQLTDRFGLQWWLGLHDQGDFYRRKYLGMAVSIRL